MPNDKAAIVPLGPHLEGLVPADLVESVRANIDAALAPATRRAYDSDWRRFTSWCEGRGLGAMPAAAATVASYATDLADAGRSVSTVRRAMASIGQAHRLAGHDSPTADAKVRVVLRGIRRRVGTAPRRAAPLSLVDLRAAVARVPAGLRGLRDRAMLLLGFAGAFRRSELVALDVDDIEQVDEGIVVTVRRSKTDQESEGRRVGIPLGAHAETCPVAALAAWLEAAGIESGPVFLELTRGGALTDRRASDRAVDRLVKRAAKAAGLDPTSYSAHSLRAGFVTAAVKAGKREDRIMAQTGHRSHAVMQGYIREAGIFVDNAAAGLGL